MKKLIPLILICMVAIFSASDPTSAAIKDVRGVWVSTVYSLDYPASPTTSPEKLRAYADDILDNCIILGMNTVYLQVRPSSDAIYPSNIYPWSIFLTGTQGVAPSNNFDPLAYWVDGAHKRGLKIEAWLNPYRVANNVTEFNDLAGNSPAVIHPDWVYEYNGKYYFDPGLPEVRQMVVNGAKEILDKYDVDGIHLDDYFYPGGDAQTDTFDNNSFAANPNGFTDKGDWRRNNNDLLIQALEAEAKAHGKVFGVSPAGIWANKSPSMPNGSLTKGNQTYFSAYADTRKWVKNGWVDYICPQIYWEIGFEIADYKVLANWWADVVSGTNVKLYIGMADYKYVNGAGSWTDINIIKNQLKLNATIPQITGEVHFRFYFLIDKPMLTAVYQEEYLGKAPALVSPLQSHDAYVKGSDGVFQPDNNLTRGEFFTILARLQVDANGNKTFNPKAHYVNSFKDVPKGAWYKDVIGFMEVNGLLYGYSDGTVHPEDNISRAECATLLSRFFAMTSGLNSGFSDVPNSYWAHDAIANCSAKGYVNGDGKGIFRPDDYIQRSEAVKMVNKVLGREPNNGYFDSISNVNPYSDVNKDHWAYYQIMEASHSHPTH